MHGQIVSQWYCYRFVKVSMLKREGGKAVPFEAGSLKRQPGKLGFLFAGWLKELAHYPTLFSNFTARRVLWRLVSPTKSQL